MRRRVVWFSVIALSSTVAVSVVIKRLLHEGRAQAQAVDDAADFASDLAVSPNPVPLGRSEVFILSWKALPEAITVEPATRGATLEAVERISPQAIKLALQIDGSEPQISLRVVLDVEEVIITLWVGAKQESIAVAANIPADALIDGRLLADTPTFVYGYEGGDGPDWQGIGILNLTTGKWHVRRGEVSPLRDAALLDVDTDGDGILDRDDPDDAPSPRADFIGLELIEGLNELRVFTFTKTGLSSMEELLVEHVKS